MRRLFSFFFPPAAFGGILFLSDLSKGKFYRLGKADYRISGRSEDRACPREVIQSLPESPRFCSIAAILRQILHILVRYG
jgi:hypothetical protein